MLPQLNNTHWAFTRPFQSPVIRGDARLLSEIYDKELENVCRKAYQKITQSLGMGLFLPPNRNVNTSTSQTGFKCRCHNTIIDRHDATDALL